MPPSNNTSSPVKRPGLGRRAISSHAVVTRAANPNDPSDLPPTNHPQKPQYRQHRPHVVGGAHRTHVRNPSLGKNLTKTQRLTSAHQVGADAAVRTHHRKKSAPATSASPRDTQHILWDGELNDGGGGGGDGSNNHTAASMRKNYSSPSLQRSTSGLVAKKALVANRTQTSSGRNKKTVGFELAGSDNDDGEWEDTTQSPLSTRRSSLAQGKDGVENTTVLVDPLTFVKRPFPQAPLAASLPAPNNFPQQGHLAAGEEGKRHAEDHQEQSREPEHNDIAARFFSPAHSTKAPPAMSSISAMAKPSVLDDLSRNTSLTNLAGNQNNARRTPSASTAGMANTPGSQTQGTSSSMEGGVSKFIVNNRSAMYPSSRPDSDPNTPSSFLPHYHPHTPPSPNHTPNKPRGSPPSRQPGTEPPSRTQQKLWLQRTAALNTPPPDSNASAVSPSAMDPAFMAAVHSRPGAYDTGRGAMVNGGPRTGGAPHGGEGKHIRKAYEKTAQELAVVRRFQSPTGDSFSRLSSIISEAKAAAAPTRPSPLGKSFISDPALSLLREGRQDSRGKGASSPEPKQLMGRKTPESNAPAAQARPDDPINTTTTDLPHRFKSQHASKPILSTSDEASRGRVPADENLDDDSRYPNETDMMIRRMWESREVATSG